MADAVADADAAFLEFDHADGDAVDVQHKIGTALEVAFEGDFFRNGEVVLCRMIPVNQMDGLGNLTGTP